MFCHFLGGIRVATKGRHIIFLLRFGFVVIVLIVRFVLERRDAVCMRYTVLGNECMGGFLCVLSRSRRRSLFGYEVKCLLSFMWFFDRAHGIENEQCPLRYC